MANNRKVSTTVYLTQDQVEALRVLSAHTKVPYAEYVRQGVALLLEREAEALREAGGVISTSGGSDHG